MFFVNFNLFLPQSMYMAQSALTQWIGYLPDKKLEIPNASYRQFLSGCQAFIIIVAVVDGVEFVRVPGAMCAYFRVRSHVILSKKV